MVPLAEEHIASLDAGIALFDAGDRTAAIESVVSPAVLEPLIAARAEFGSIRTLELERLDDNVRRAADLEIFVAVTSLMLAALSLAIAAAFLLVLRRRHLARVSAEAAAAKDEFVGFISHELRGPMAIIAGNARLLANGTLRDGDREAVLAEMTAASDRMNGIIEALLSLSKAESGVALEVEPILLARIAESVRRHHCTRFPARDVAIDVPPALPPALGDRGAVEQVLVNLLSNAEKYGDAAAPIRIVITAAGADQVVSVDNAGPAIPPEQLRRVFEPFFRMPATRAAVPGVGLGLTVCHRLVTAQGGRMSAESLCGGGARFSFTLPAVVETLAGAAI
jgi:signal transduction histidine kinase